MFRARLLVIALFALLAAGCGGDFGDVTAPPDTITTAVEKTSRLPSFRSSFHGLYSAPDMGWRLKFKGKGLYDGRRRLSSVELRLSGSAVEGCTIVADLHSGSVERRPITQATWSRPAPS